MKLPNSTEKMCKICFEKKKTIVFIFHEQKISVVGFILKAATRPNKKKRIRCLLQLSQVAQFQEESFRALILEYGLLLHKRP